jgi:hypothetical protein
MALQRTRHGHAPRRVSADRPNTSNEPKPAPKESIGATIGDMLKAKGKALA